MDFSSISAYLDPSNWQQQPNPQPGASSGNPQLPPPLPPPPPPQPHVGGGTGSIRPSSMAHRAQMANIPMPEAALRCPRCDSPNTKFCYFNNYSLTQPRHFCKTCRRYWTRGGALRNVPVGGGCRRNKKSKAGSSSKSPAPGSDRQTSSGSSGAVSSNSAGTASILAGLTPQIPPPLHFMSPLSQLSKYGAGDIGLNYGGIGISSAPLVATNDMNFQLGSGSLGGGGSGGGGYGVEQWLSQPAAQISSVGGLDFPVGLYPFQGGIEPPGYGGEGSQVTQVRPKLSTSGMTQQNSVKMEENKELNLARQFLGIQGNDQYWSGSPWTDLSGCSSSSTRNPL